MSDRKLDQSKLGQTNLGHDIFRLANSIVQFVQIKLENIEFWSAPYNKVNEDLRQSLLLCEQWESACSMLTGHMWKRVPTHSWKGEPFQSSTLTGFKNRLEEVKIFKRKNLHSFI